MMNDVLDSRPYDVRIETAWEAEGIPPLLGLMLEERSSYLNCNKRRELITEQ